MKQPVIVIKDIYKTDNDNERRLAIQAIVNRYIKNKIKTT